MHTTALAPGAWDEAIAQAPDLAAGAAGERFKLAIRASLFPGAREMTAKVGRFSLLRELGHGGMGVVFMAYDETLDRRIALKLLHGHAGDNDGQLRLLREAQAMARINHPNIAAVYEAGTADERVYVAMEFVQGRSLATWLREQPRPWLEVVQAFVQAARGLQAAHAAGLVHRDFKPANAMIGDDGRVRVLDFGLARGGLAVGDRGELPGTTTSGGAVGGDDAEGAITEETLRRLSLTQEGAVLGTPAYMAPEQFRGERADARADQFALCVSLYEGLYGRAPFAGKTLTALAAAVLGGHVRPPPSTSVPGWVTTAVLRGLSVDPARRFTSMAALIEALEPRPRHTARNWILGAAAAAGVATGLAAFESRNACLPDPEALVGVWDSERAQAVEAAIQRVDSPFAAPAWRSTKKQLDLYAERWTAGMATACEEHRTGEDSDLLFERRRACYERRRLQMRATVDAIQLVDAGTLAQVELAVGSLPSLSACDNEAALLQTVAPPEEGAEAEAVARLEAQVLELAARAAFMTREDLDGEAEVLVAEARALGYRPTLARALRAQFIRNGDVGVESDCRALHESYALADAAGDDASALESASWAVDCAMRTGAGEGATDTWLSLGHAKVERGSLRDSDEYAALLIYQGERALQKRDLEGAVRCNEEALAVFEEDPARSPGLVLTARNNLVVLLRERLGFHHPTVATQVTELVDECKRAHDWDSAPCMFPRLNYALLLATQGRRDEALAEIKSVEQISADLCTGCSPRIRRESLRALALVHLMVFDPDAAEESLARLKHQAEQDPDWSPAEQHDFFGLFGQVAMIRGDYEAARVRLERALQAASAAGQPGVPMLPLHHTLEGALRRLGADEAAQQQAVLAQEIVDAVGDDQLAGLFQAQHRQFAISAYVLQDPEESLRVAERERAIALRMNDAASQLTALTDESIAHGLLEHCAVVVAQIPALERAGALTEPVVRVMAASTEMTCGDLDAARRHARALAETAGLALLHMIVDAEMALAEGQFQVALNKARQLVRRPEILLGGAELEGGMLAIQGEAALATGQLAEARASSTRAIERMTSAVGPHSPYLAAMLTTLGRVDLAEGKLPEAIAHLERALGMRTRFGADPFFRARTRFALAQALARTPDRQAEALTQARAARSEFAESGPRFAAELAEVDAYLGTLTGT